MGNRQESLMKAMDMLTDFGKIAAKSKVYESPAWGYQDDNSYLNMVCAMETRLEIEALHRATLSIEVALGREVFKRKQGEPYRPRLIDIDILFFGDAIFETDSLSIPHPQLHLRNFVLKPMVEIAPDFMHPKMDLSMKELLSQSMDLTVLQEFD